MKIIIEIPDDGVEQLLVKLVTAIKEAVEPSKPAVPVKPQPRRASPSIPVEESDIPF